MSCPRLPDADLRSGCVPLLLTSIYPTLYFHGTPSVTLNLLGGTFLWLSTFIDGSLSLALFFLLRRHFEHNLRSIRSVVRVSFQTALLTSVFSLVGAVSAVAWPQTHVTTANMIIAFSLPLSSLYALSLVVTLASRKHRPVVVAGTTLTGYQQHGLLQGLPGGQPGADGGASRQGVGMPRVTQRRLGSADGEDEREDDDEKGGEKGRGGKADGWRSGEWGRGLDIELWTEEGGSGSVLATPPARPSASTRPCPGAGTGALRTGRSRSSDRRSNLHVGFA